MGATRTRYVIYMVVITAAIAAACQRQEAAPARAARESKYVPPTPPPVPGKFSPPERAFKWENVKIGRPPRSHDAEWQEALRQLHKRMPHVKFSCMCLDADGKRVRECDCQEKKGKHRKIQIISRKHYREWSEAMLDIRHSQFHNVVFECTCLDYQGNTRSCTC